MIHPAPAHPARPSIWLFGEAGGIQVWAADGDPKVRVAVLIGVDMPVVILNRLLVGTPAEMAALTWALAEIARGEPGFYVSRN